MKLYTPLKMFHFQEKLDSLPEDNPEIKPPLHIRLKPSNVCNHRCGYCAYRAEGLQLGQDMNLKDMIPGEKLLELVEDFSELGVKAVTFSGGGEPFCHPHLAETARALADANISFASLTNGSRLVGEVAEVFAEKAVWLRVSMDGYDAESYARYRNVDEDEFAKVLSNIESFQKLGGECFLGVSYIVDQGNADHVYAMTRRLKETGVNSVKISPCITANSGAEVNAYHHPIFDTVKEQAERAVAELQDDGFEVFDSYHLQMESFAKEYTWCPYQQVLPVIGADMNVYTCQDKAYNLEDGLIGSIREQRFKDFWMADKAKFFRTNPSVHCNHHCVANGKNLAIFDYLGADPRHLPFV